MSKKSRREFLQTMAALGASSLLPGCGGPLELSNNSLDSGSLGLSSANDSFIANTPFYRGQGQITGAKQNVIFISIDDLNDWISPLAGYDGEVFTPNLMRLANRSVTFEQAYCAAPYCGASRSSTMTGMAPWKSKMMYQENILEHESEVRKNMNLSSIETIPRYFKQQGYEVKGGGKIFHGGFGNQRGQWSAFDEATWVDYLNFVWNDTNPNYRLKNNDNTLAGMIGAAYNSSSEEAKMPDKQLAKWASQQIMNYQAGGAPLFLGVGFYRPHISWFVPQRFYDMYPLASIKPPQLQEQLQDLNDLPGFAVKYLSNMPWTSYGEKMPDGSASSDHYSLFNKERVNGYDGHAQAIQAYLASISFADECLGEVLDALELSGMLQNSIVMLWSDHGWFLGEKLSWRKYKLWERATRVPLMISAPGSASGVKTAGVASLLDLFPTLIDLTSSGQNSQISGQTQGRSLRSLLENPKSSWAGEAVTSQLVPEAGNAKIYSLRDQRYRYIMYPDQPGQLSEELYDLRADPQEKNNLIYSNPTGVESLRMDLRQRLLKSIS